MTTPELLAFVKSEIGRGISQDDINSKLKSQGWTEEDIAETYLEINQSSKVPPETVGSTMDQTAINPSTNSNSSSFTAGQFVSESASSRIPNTFITNERPRSNKFTKIILVVVALIILLSGGLVVYGSGYFLSADKIFSRFSEGSEENQTFSFDINAKIDVTGMMTDDIFSTIFPENDEKIIKINSKGSIDMSNEEKVKANNSFSMSMGKVEIEMETRTIDESFYLNITKAPNLGFISLAPFEDRWIVINDEAGSLEDNPLMAESPINPSTLTELTEEQENHLTELVKNAHLIKITKKHLPQMINGSLSYHLEFGLDKLGIESFLKESLAYLKTQYADNLELQELNADDLGKIFEDVDNFKGEAWIGIFDGLINKIAIYTDILDKESDKEGARSSLELVMTYSDWGKPVTVVAPTSTTTIEELMTELLGGMFGGMLEQDNGGVVPAEVTIDSADEGKDKAKDAAIQATLASLRVSAVIYSDNHQNSYKGFCSDKGQYGAYQQAIRLPPNSVYRCNDSATEYAAWTKLSGGNYWCVDSKETFEAVTSLPKGTSCH